VYPLRKRDGGCGIVRNDLKQRKIGRIAGLGDETNREDHRLTHIRSGIELIGFRSLVAFQEARPIWHPSKVEQEESEIQQWQKHEGEFNQRHSSTSAASLSNRDNKTC
jgi:hypothetical protein